MNVKDNAAEFLDFEGVRLNVAWHLGHGRSSDLLPDKPGLYAEIYWPERGVRIGETGRSIRGKIRHDIRWFKTMHAGTAPPEQLRRTLPIAMAAKRSGVVGFEFFTISVDPRLADKELRQNAERYLFSWVRSQKHWVDWNRQVSWR
jgi:hypothetical protein